MISSRRRIVIFAIYLVLLAGIAWQAVVVAKLFTPGGKYVHTRSYKVNVQGDVRRPGTYRVQEGTSQFEILKVAGVRPTSDLSAFNLIAGVDENKDIKVGSLDKAVEVNRQSVPVRVEFFYGDVLVTSKDGRTTAAQQGSGLGEGYRISTENSSQAEVSVGTFSRIDLDNFSDLSFDKIGTTEADRNVVEMFQKSGSCWYKITYEKNNEQVRIIAPSTTVTVSGNGANFLIAIASDNVAINLIDGQLLIERPDGGESINLIAGQTVTIYNDGRPFQIAKLAPDLSAQERFSQLQQERKTIVSTNMPYNFLWCGASAAFYVISIQFDKGLVSMVDVPAQLQVDQFADGISTIAEADLYGGPTFVISLLERILNVRLNKFSVFTKDNIIKAGNIIGGVSVSLDAKGAAKLGKSAGTQKLSSTELVSYLSQGSSDAESHTNRELAVLRAIFDGLKSKGIVLTPTSVQQILSLIESNFTPGEVMDLYLKFSGGGTKWSSKEMRLPVDEIRNKGRLQYVPNLEKCRALLGNS